MSVRSIAVNYTVNTGPLVAGNRAAAASMGQVATAQRAVTAGSARVAGGFRQMATGAGLLNPALLGPAGAVLALRKAFNAAADFEHQFADVRKTLDATPAEFDRIARSIQQMSLEMPNTTQELNAIASAAGQLGVAADEVAEFTRVMAMVGTATNMAADEAAMQFARFANITQTPLDQVEALASTVVALGNNFAAQESEIVGFAMRIAGAGAQVGMTNDQIFALSTALPAMGLRAEMGGSAVSRIMVEMANSVAQGTEEVHEFARVSGMTVEQFSTAWREDAAGAFLVFLEGLQKAGAAGENTFAIIEELGLSAIRTQDTLLRGSSAWEVYGEALGLSAEEMEAVNALQDEFANKASTTNSQMAIFGNNAQESFRQAGEGANEFANNVLPMVNEQLARTNLVFGMLADADIGRFEAVLRTILDPTSIFDMRETVADNIERTRAIAQATEGDLHLLGLRHEYMGQTAEGAADGISRAANANDDAAYSGRLAADAWSGFGREVEGTLEAIQDYNDAILAMEDPLFAVEQATTRLAEEQEKLTELQDDSDTTAAEYEAQLWKVASAASGQEQALLELWATMDDGTFTAEDAANRFRELGESAGLSESDINRLIGEIGGFVDQANALEPVRIELDARAQAETKARLAQMRADFDALFGHVDEQLNVERVMKAEADVREGRMTVDAFARFMDAEIRRARVAELKADASSGIEVVDSFSAAADRAVTKERQAEIQADADDGMRVLDSFTAMADRAARERTMRLRVLADAPPQLRGLSGITMNHAGAPAGQGRPHDGILKPGEVPIIAEYGEWVINKRASAKHHDLLAAINADAFHDGGVPGGARSSGVIGGDIGRLATAIEQLQATIERDRSREQRAGLTGSVSDAQRDVRQAKSAKERAAANERLAEARKNVARYDRDAARQAALSAMQDEQARLQTELRAAEEREALELRIRGNRREHLMSQMAVEEQLGHLDRRIAGERAFTDEWMQLVGRREQIAQQEADRTRQAADQAVDDLNRMLDDRTRILDRLETNETAHLEATAAEHQRYADAVAHAQDRASDAVAQAVDARTRALREAATPNLSGWDHRAHIITEAVGQETDRLTEWAAALDTQRGRGLSDDVVDLLGLRDATPEALHQLRRLAQASDQELTDLNAAVARQMATVNATVRAEQRDANSQLARDIAGIHDSLSTELRELQNAHHTTLSEMNATFTADQRALRDELAQIGADSGRSYVDAIAEGVASGIPGLVDQVRRVQDLMRQAKEAEARASAPPAAPMTLKDQIAGYRQSVGATADSASDDIWVRRINAGTHTLAEAQNRIAAEKGVKSATYDVGGTLEPGFTLAYNGTGASEHVLTPVQMSAVAAAGAASVDLSETNSLLRRLVHAADRGQVVMLDTGTLVGTVGRRQAVS